MLHNNKQESNRINHANYKFGFKATVSNIIVSLFISSQFHFNSITIYTFYFERILRLYRVSKE